MLAVSPLFIWYWFTEYQYVAWISRLGNLICLLTLYFILEATRQPQDKSTPLHGLIGQFNTRRDRVVALTAFIVPLALVGMTELLDLSSSTKLAMIPIFLLSFYLIRITFGTQELREASKPDWPEIW
jgi:hypothetical protein